MPLFMSHFLSILSNQIDLDDDSDKNLALKVASKEISIWADPYCTTLAGVSPITDYSSHIIQRGFFPKGAGMATDIAAWASVGTGGLQGKQGGPQKKLCVLFYY